MSIEQIWCKGHTCVFAVYTLPFHSILHDGGGGPDNLFWLIWLQSTKGRSKGIFGNEWISRLVIQFGVKTIEKLVS